MPRRPAAASWMSAGLTILLLCLCRLGFGLRLRRAAVLIVPLVALLALLLHHARHVDDEVAGDEVHDLHALRVAAADADALDGDANHDPLLGDHHQLVVGEHFLEGDDVARLGTALQRDDAAAAAVLNPVFVELRALAHPLLGHHEQRGLAAHHDHVDHVVLLVELDALHAGRRAPHVAHVLLVETDAHAVVRGEDDV